MTTTRTGLAADLEATLAGRFRGRLIGAGVGSIVVAASLVGQTACPTEDCHDLVDQVVTSPSLTSPASSTNGGPITSDVYAAPLSSTDAALTSASGYYEL